MERQNITLSTTKITLKKAKYLAVAKGQSFSGLLTEFIEDLIRQEERYKLAERQQLVLMIEGIDFELKEIVDWSRAEIHERG